MLHIKLSPKPFEGKIYKSALAIAREHSLLYITGGWLYSNGKDHADKAHE